VLAEQEESESEVLEVKICGIKMDTRRSVLGGALLVETPCVGSPRHKNPWVEILWNPLTSPLLETPWRKSVGGTPLPPKIQEGQEISKTAQIF
jgi:hypothetical protein